ncbi:MAG: hypothetical protein IJ785_05485 [Bacteroidales bacterium]|nr:hypothetical protein [Bacteroidales bacterium]
MKALISKARKDYHSGLLSKGILTIDDKGVPSNADGSSKLSVGIARIIAEKLKASNQIKNVGQTVGARFEALNMEFLNETFPHMQNLRPGEWYVSKLGNNGSKKVYDFSQYEHLDYLAQLTKADSRLAASMGNDYMVAPDIVVYRMPESDESINRHQMIVDSDVCQLSDLRKSNGGLPILHASVSAKWTMRSDRAQNSRTEALGLIRNRKGHLPHIVVVTGEPLPSRIASLALGTGDIDCVYHVALPELKEAVAAIGAEDAAEMLEILISGKRLKDIGDLPLDLAV